MTKQLESVQIILAGNTYLYKLFQHIFGNEPSNSIIAILNSDMTKEALDIYNSQDNEGFANSIEFLSELSGRFEKKKEVLLEQLIGEYTRLFIGPNKMPAPPWESVFRTEERLLFQESTLEIRRCYLKYNFLPLEYPHVADDHLALELDFMASLSSLAEKAYSDGDFNQLQEILKDQKEFLENHLLLWIPEFAQKIQESATHYLYPNMTGLLNEFLRIQIGVIEEIKSTL